MNLNVNQTVHAVGPDWQGDTLLAVGNGTYICTITPSDPSGPGTAGRAAREEGPQHAGVPEKLRAQLAPRGSLSSGRPH